MNDSNTIKSNFVLNWPKYFQIVNKNKQPIDISSANQVSLSDFIGRTRLVLTPEERRDLYLTLLRGFLVQNPSLSKIFNNVALAMKLVRRPICTLEQYIDFYKTAPDFINPTSSASGGRGRGVRARTSYLDSSTQTAPYYHIIREFVPGPGIEPGAKAQLDGITTDDLPKQAALELKYYTAGPGNSLIQELFTRINVGEIASVQDLPDLAANTQELLLLYADIIKAGGAL